MATRQGNTLYKRTMNAEYGNVSKHIAPVILAAVPANDVLQCIRLEAGSTVTGLKSHHEALGAGSGYKVGIAYYDSADGTDDDDYFAVVADSASAGKATAWDGVPVTFQVPVMITLKVTGAAATGVVTLVPEYIYTGPL
jgi:hypothetical protein